MDNKRKQAGIARNRTNLFIVLLVLTSQLLCTDVVATSMLENTVQLPPFIEFNRAVERGAELDTEVTYRGLPSYKLTQGSLPPSVNGWENHSMVTTGLFAAPAPIQKKILFYMKSDDHPQALSRAYKNVLWVSFRLYDQHGVLLRSKPGVKIPVPEEWQEVAIPLKIDDPEVAFAEMWLVKYQDANFDAGFGTNKDGGNAAGTAEHISTPIAFYVSALSIDLNP